MTKRKFRVIVLLACLFYLTLLVFPFFDKYFLSEEEMNVISYAGYSAILNLPSIVLWLLVLMWGVSIFGIFYFFNWGRFLLLFWIGISSVFLVLSGMDVRTGFESSLVYISSMLDGVILSIAYFSDLSGEFTKE